MTREFHWQTAALARLMRVPKGFMRDASAQHIEDYARQQGVNEITLEVAEAGMGRGRQAKEGARAGDGAHQNSPITELQWTDAAEKRLQQVPDGFIRDMTHRAAEALAGQNGVTEIDGVFIEQVMKTIELASQDTKETLSWDADAHARIARTPDMVRGMLVKEIEGWARRHDMNRVNQSAVNAVKDEWKSRGVFHLDPNDPRSQAGG